ncbi:MAG TPA: twin-arginine translocation signal domain-containing protein [Candidatus Dormibacteraeota bacterium]|nr:twin-arginine translocation signal domain-containing protein [Candidatus Dormibacteraeota bacterium]
MTDPGITRRQIIKVAAAVGALGAVGLPSVAFAEGDGKGAGRIRWDLIDISPPDVRAGGDDTASSEGEFTLTLTGSGTFRPGHPRQVTGGGTWSTTNPDVPGSGTYRVTELVSWVLAPGHLRPPLVDHIGSLADTRAGLAVLRIKYSDGLDGILFVSCNLFGTPPSVDEGINASRGFVNFFMPAPPGFGKHSNRTLFHALHGEQEN